MGLLRWLDPPSPKKTRVGRSAFHSSRILLAPSMQPVAGRARRSPSRPARSRRDRRDAPRPPGALVPMPRTLRARSSRSCDEPDSGLPSAGEPRLDTPPGAGPFSRPALRPDPCLLSADPIPGRTFRARTAPSPRPGRPRSTKKFQTAWNAPGRCYVLLRYWAHRGGRPNPLSSHRLPPFIDS